MIFSDFRYLAWVVPWSDLGARIWDLGARIWDLDSGSGIWTQDLAQDLGSGSDLWILGLPPTWYLLASISRREFATHIPWTLGHHGCYVALSDESDNAKTVQILAS